jgi:hypothetical protein
MAARRKLCSADTECKLAIGSDYEGCISQQSDIDKDVHEEEVQPQPGTSARGDLNFHKEDTGLSIHCLGLPGVSTEMRLHVCTEK